MSDLFLEIARNPTARQAVRRLGLPLPLPQPLVRAKGPWQERPFHDETVAVGAGHNAEITDALAAALVQAGARPHITGDPALEKAFAGPGEAFGRKAATIGLAACPEDFRPQGLVFDGTGLAGPDELVQAYHFLHPLLPRLQRNGRVVLLARPPESAATGAGAAAQAGLVGLVRSLAKEIGRKGSTANILVVAPDAEGHLAGPLRFLLSRQSAFVTGQPIAVANPSPAVDNPPWERPLDQTVALVTGAARGIGAATARRLAGEGAFVYCLDRPAESSLVAELARDIGGSVILGDVRNPETPEQIVADIKARHGRLDIVVHNAGVTRDKTLARMPEKAWTEALEINLSAILAIDAAVIPKLLSDKGRIICLSSVSGLAGNVGQTNYGASKAGLVGYVEHQAIMLGSKGITVNAVAPGFIETRMTAAVPVTIRQAGRRLSSLSQGGAPQDVAEVITFLASPGAQGITGATIRVCGGALIGA